MITRQARKALRKMRATHTTMYGILAVLREGERAYQAGLPISSNPYVADTENRQTWVEGYISARDDQ